MSGIPGPTRRGMIPRACDVRAQRSSTTTCGGAGGGGATGGGGGAVPPRGRSGLPVSSTPYTSQSRLPLPRGSGIPGPSGAGGGGGSKTTGLRPPKSGTSCGQQAGGMSDQRSHGRIHGQVRSTPVMNIMKSSSSRKMTVLPSQGVSKPDVGRASKTPRRASPASKRSQDGGKKSSKAKQDEACPCAEDAEQAQWDQAKANTSALADEMDAALLCSSALQKGKTALIGTRSRKALVDPPMIKMDDGNVPAQIQVITTKSIRKKAGQPDVVGRDVTTIEASCCGPAQQTEVVMSRMAPLEPHSQFKKEETIIVQSKVSIAPGLKQTVKTVTYEGDPSMIRRAPVLPSVEEVARLVEEESQMIDQTLALHMPDVQHISPTSAPLRKQAKGYSIDKETVAKMEAKPTCATCVASPQPQEELTAEMIVEMMNTEERGLAMGQEPENVYNYLFANSPDAGDEKKVQVTSVAAYPFTDVVVPGELPDMSKDVQSSEDVQNVSIHAVSSLTGNPEDNSYCAVVGDDPIEPKNTAKLGQKTKRKRITPISQEPPPWGAIEEDKVEEVIDLVGGALAESRVVREEAEEEVDPWMEGIEYVLQMEAPSHYTQVQLRGTQKPDWFPGYLMALPGEDNLVVVRHNPEDVLTAAWRATQPDVFSDDSMFVI